MNNHSKNITTAFIIGTIIFLVAKGLSGGFQFESFNQFLVEFSFYQMYSFVLGFSNLYYFRYLEMRKWEENSMVKRISIGVLGALMISLVGLFLLRLLTALLYNGQSFAAFIENERIENYNFGIWISLTIIITFHFIYFYNKYQKTKVKESQIVAKTESAKFESLKNQLDPHFLFNSLNVLTSLIGENPAQAEKFTTKLSKVYRYVLEQKDKDLISLDEELKFARSYMQLLQMRFEDAVEYTIPEMASNPDLKIVPLSLQLLLENAVKHNIITSSLPLQIKIYEHQGYLYVENSLNPKSSLEKSTKVGLKNITQRYELVSSNKVVIEKGSDKFIVKLPLLTQKIQIMRTDYMLENAKYMRAKKKVDDLKGFYASLVAYVVVMPFLITLNYKTSWHFQWFWFPMFGWGLGLIIGAFNIFGYGGNWEARKIKEIMEKENKYKY
jgi:two-component system LytT family sensor kinase